MTEQVYNRSEQIKEAGMATRYQPGQSGNPAGRPVNSVTALLKNQDALTNQQIAQVIINKVLAGEFQFVREYLDRTDGRVVEKHLNVNVDATPESIQAAKERLLEAQNQTTSLLERYPKRATD